MIYFRKNDEVIEKYQVNFDEEEIEKIKKEIIDNCSYVEHIEYKSDYSPRFTNEIVRNYRCIPTGEEMEYFEEVRDIYLYSYDEYKSPYLVELINQLLNGNSGVIDKILNYDISSELTIDDKINLASQEIIKIEPENIPKIKAKLIELEELLKVKELNKDKQGIELYYNKLKELIKFDLIDSLLFSELERVESFLGINLNSNFKDNVVIKSLKKIN